MGGSTIILFDQCECFPLSITFWYRVYVNRSVSMDRIKYIGFDMDYTLVGKLRRLMVWNTTD